MSKPPVRVAVTGAAGQIGYAIVFRIASGEMLGKDQPVVLSLLEVPAEKPQAALKGVMMELEDCAFPLLAGMEAHSDPMTAFKDADYALLIGSRPRGPGMERAELLAVNGEIFTALIMVIFTVALLVQLVFGGPLDYYKWASIFARQWMKVLTFVVIVSMLWHVWVGMRDIWMDYVKPMGVRLTLEVLTIAWLVGCAGWAVQVLWRL